MQGTITSFRAKPEYIARVKVLAKSQHRTASYIYNRLLENYLEEFEDVCEAEKILTDIKDGKMKTYTAEQVCKELGIDCHIL